MQLVDHEIHYMVGEALARTREVAGPLRRVRIECNQAFLAREAMNWDREERISSSLYVNQLR